MSGKECSMCSTRFGIFSKEVTCRLCGKSLCNGCSSTTRMRSGVGVSSCSACALRMEEEIRRREEKDAAEQLAKAEELDAKMKALMSKQSLSDRILGDYDAGQSRKPMQSAPRAVPPPLPPRTVNPPRTHVQAAVDSAPDEPEPLLFPEVPQTIPTRATDARPGEILSDQALDQRMSNLKGSRPPAHDEHELAERLARLTGKPNILTKRLTNTIAMEDRRTEAEKVEDLLRQAADHARIKKNMPRATLDSDSEVDTDDEADRVISAVGDARRLGMLGQEHESAAPDHGGHTSRKAKSANQNPAWRRRASSASSSDSESDQFCCICTEDATLVCKKCFNDVFCKRCFMEVHKEDPSIKNHHGTLIKRHS